MSMADSARYRERLVLMASLDDEGLEELILRLARPEYPDAHRTRRGRDGGVDVLSDLENPPQRGWQCKNYTDNNIDWTKCRKSLKAAMTGAAPPRRYTFVFPRRMKESERNFWRDEFLPEQQRLYEGKLETLDYWDNLAERLEERPDLVNRLNDGALAGYTREVLSQSVESGVNPLASAPDLAEGASGIADHARSVGETDPRFAYGVAGREAGEADQGLPDRHLLFTLRRGQYDSLPRYAMTLRQGSAISELTAQPRKAAQGEELDLWFSDQPEGEEARSFARTELAKGRPVTLRGDGVGVDPGEVPDRFRSMLDEAGLLRSGTLEIGLTEPLTLEVRLPLPGGQGTEVMVPIPVFRVPAMLGDTLSYAGAFGGTILALNFREQSETSREGVNQVEVTIDVLLSLEGETPHDALRGLGFVRAFGRSEGIHFNCRTVAHSFGGGVRCGRQPPECAVVGLGDLDDLTSLGSQVLQVGALVLLSLGREKVRDGIGLAGLVRELATSIREVELGQMTAFNEPVQVARGQD